MNGKQNHNLRLIGGRFYVVVRTGDRDVRVFAGDNITLARQTRDDVLESMGRVKPKPVKKAPRVEELAAEMPKRLPSRQGDYFAVGCVLLLAAVYRTQAAFEWAADTLRPARNYDARRFS